MRRIKDKHDFQRRLFSWFKSHKRALPWRGTRDPYKIWVSEVMLQQTTVQAVLPYYEKWLRLFPDVRSLAEAPIQNVLKAWQGLGYYQRARNLHKAAKIIMDMSKGRIPDTYEELIKLPGLGPYTTPAVLSIAFNKPYPMLDANIRRVFMRLLLIRGEARPNNDRYILQELTELLPGRKTGQFNQALMELGALVCKSQSPQCLACPVQDHCCAYKEGLQEAIPAPKKRDYQKVEAVVAIISEDRKYLIQKRPEDGLLAGLWEFPGGKRKQGESLEKAIRREVQEELGVDMKEVTFLAKFHHSYTRFQVTLNAYACTLKQTPQLKKGLHRWVTLRSLKRYPFPSGSAKIVQFLEEKDKKKRIISQKVAK